MSAVSDKTTGGCLCGAVRYEAVGKPVCVGHCHCHTCRRHTGAPMVTFVAFEAENVCFPERDRNIYNSSPSVKRGFCANCGTPLTWEGSFKGMDIIEFHISTTDDPDAYAPDLHWHHGERIRWFEVIDNLPRYFTTETAGEPYLHGPASHDKSAEN